MGKLRTSPQPGRSYNRPASNSGNTLRNNYSSCGTKQQRSSCRSCSGALCASCCELLQRLELSQLLHAAADRLQLPQWVQLLQLMCAAASSNAAVTPATPGATPLSQQPAATAAAPYNTWVALRNTSNTLVSQSRRRLQQLQQAQPLPRPSQLPQLQWWQQPQQLPQLPQLHQLCQRAQLNQACISHITCTAALPQHCNSSTSASP